MAKKALYVEIDTKVLTNAKRLALRLNIPMTKLVELALKEVIDNDPQLRLNLKDASTGNQRKSSKRS